MQSRFVQFIVPVRNREPRPKKMSRVDRLRMRTKGRCGYCGVWIPKGETTRDHVVPRAKDGKTCDANLMCCCFDCNQRKASLSLEEFRELYFGGGPFWHEVLEGGAA